MKIKIGRPPIPAKTRKGTISAVRLNPGERKAIEQAAAGRGLTLSDWMRSVLVDTAHKELS